MNLNCKNIKFRCRKGDPFQALRVDSCLTLGNELSEETHLLTKQKTLLERDAWAESSRGREPSWLAVSVFLVMG